MLMLERRSTQNMKVLVDGGNGLYGNGTLRALLARGAEVVSFDLASRPWYMDDLMDKVKFVRGDLLSPTDLLRVCKEEKVDRIVHLAGFMTSACQENPWAGCQLNIIGTVMALDVARILGLDRVVCAGSTAAAGNVSDSFDEEVPRDPISIYGMTKLAVEHLVENYARTHGVDGLVLRPTLGYGPGRWISPPFTLVVPALQGRTLEVKDDGWTMDLLYYKDAGAAFATAVLADTPSHRVFNLGNGTGKRLTMGELASLLQEIIPGSQFEIETVGGMGSTSTSQPATDVTRIGQELGWQPEYPPEKGLPDYVAWMKEHYLPRLG
jgi:nucleoside-diphosphate-sugar epimerase